MSSAKFNQFLKAFGPGIMFAGTCIGGSHLIQSTKAGAFYGFGLLAVVLFANVFKYPFFEFASRYTNATGNSILEGYKKLGKAPIYIYAAVTLFSMFIITAAIFAFTAGLANNFCRDYFSIEINRLWWPVIIFGLVFSLLSYGKFKVLDATLKAIGLVLVITVTVAFFMLLDTPTKNISPQAIDILRTPGGFAFAIFLMGWMPMGVDMSAWHSLWTQERIKQTGYHPTLKETLLDFKIGYAITVVLAVFFLAIGAKTLYGVATPEHIKSLSGVGYAHLLVEAFVSAMGNWSAVIISIAAFSTMFGTSITLADGYCRSINRTMHLIKTDNRPKEEIKESKQSYLLWVALLFVGSYLLIFFVGAKLSNILNLATGTSFMIAPIAAYFNYRIVFSDDVPLTHQPPQWLKWLAIVGLVIITSFSIGYVYVLFTA
jgi:Mn2+/Fe2+ NRAMP family transporter